MRRGLRWLGRLVVVLLGAWLLYVGVANLFLNVEALQRWIGDVQDAADVSLERGVSWWPGRVSGEGLEIRVHNAQVEMQLLVDRFETDIELSSVLEPKFETHSSTITGVRLKLRLPRPLEALCAAPAGLPRIPGLADPAGAGEGPCLEQAETFDPPSGTRPPPEDRIRVEMHDLRLSDIDEVWVEQYRVRVEGEGRLAGSWRYWRTQEVQVTLTDLALAGLSLSVAGQERLRGVRVEGRTHLPTVRLADASAPPAWASLSVDAEIGFEHAELALLAAAVKGAPPVAPPKLPVVEGAVTGSVAFAMSSGRFERARADVRGLELRADLVERSLSGRARARLRASSEGDGRIAIDEARVEVDDPVLRGPEESETFHRTTLEVWSTANTWVAPGDQRARLTLRARSSRAALLTELVPGDLKSLAVDAIVGDDRPATANAVLDATRERVRLESLDLQADDLRVQGDLELVPEVSGTLDIGYGGLTFHRRL